MDLNKINLSAGAHSPGDSMCLMEAVAFLAGENWSDRPQCVSPVLAAYGRTLNDWLTETDRQRLVSLIPRLMGTANDGRDETRAFMAADYAVRTFAPIALKAAGLTEQAETLRALPQIVDSATASYAASRSSNASYAASYASHAASYAASYAASRSSYAASNASNAASNASYAASRSSNAAYAASRSSNAAYAASRSSNAAYASYAAYASNASSYAEIVDISIELFEKMIAA